MRALLVILDATSRLGLVLAVLFLVGDPRSAAAVAVLATLLTACRYRVRGAVLDRETRSAWAGVVASLRAKEIRALETLRQDEAGTTLIFDAVRELALHRASTVPDLIAGGVVAVGLVVLLVVRVGWVWLAVGAVCGAALLAVMVPALRQQRRAQLRGFATIGPLARDFQAFVGAAPELRANGSEAAVERSLASLASEQASAEREAGRFGALHAAVPAVVAGVAALMPRAMVDALEGSGRLFDLGVLAMGLLAALLGLIRGAEGARRAIPYLEALESLGPRRSAPGARDRERERTRTLAFERVTVVHPGGRAAPHDLSFRLERGGLAIVGSNGAGKSTAVKLALGLLRPDVGRVLAGGEAVEGPLASNRVAYLPQRPYVDFGESLAFHLRLAGIDPEDVWLDQALRRAGLDATLGRRGEASRLLTRIGSLSGGEIQRFLIARTLGRPADLAVLDEPEVGLDPGGRADLRAWLEEAAADRLVLLIAHDESVVPATFSMIRLEDESRAAPAGRKTS